MTVATPTQIVHQICGSPPVDKCSEGGKGLCYVCGGAVGRSVTVRDWMTDSYTDQTRIAVPLASHVCEACCFVMGRLSPVPGRPAGLCKGCGGTGKVTSVAKKGKTKNSTVGDPCPKCEGSGQASAGGNFRNFGHLWEDGWEAPAFGDGDFSAPNYANASKGQKPLIREFLARNHKGPWFCAVANSGQKHVLPYTAINVPGRAGNVLFDEVLVAVPQTTELIHILCQLLTDGATKEELEKGNYRPQTWTRLGKDRLREFEHDHGRQRGGWFSLALWLAQRDEEAVAERVKDEQIAIDKKKEDEKANAKKQRVDGQAGKPDRRSRGDDTGRVPARKKGKAPDGLLDAAAKPAAGSGKNKRDSGGVPNELAAKTPDGRPVQLGFFGND